MLPTLTLVLLWKFGLEAALGISIPHTWPPESYDADAIEWMLARLDEDSGFDVWGLVLGPANPAGKGH